jgi:hypothetical protein
MWSRIGSETRLSAFTVEADYVVMRAQGMQTIGYPKVVKRESLNISIYIGSNQNPYL